MVDGAAGDNPGPAGCGAVIYTTNNVAEYEALLMGLEALIELKRKRILVQSDSQLLVRQLSGEYRVTDEKLEVLYQRATGLLRQFGSYRIVHVRREFNEVADRLANLGIDHAAR